VYRIPGVCLMFYTQECILLKPTFQDRIFACNKLWNLLPCEPKGILENSNFEMVKELPWKETENVTIILTEGFNRIFHKTKIIYLISLQVLSA